jgi:hypothetical protein
MVSFVSNVAQARDGNPLCLLVCLSCQDMFEVKSVEGCSYRDMFCMKSVEPQARDDGGILCLQFCSS